jgi:hypothetical protein
VFLILRPCHVRFLKLGYSGWLLTEIKRLYFSVAVDCVFEIHVRVEPGWLGRSRDGLQAGRPMDWGSTADSSKIVFFVVPDPLVSENLVAPGIEPLDL